MKTKKHLPSLNKRKMVHCLFIDRTFIQMKLFTHFNLFCMLLFIFLEWTTLPQTTHPPLYSHPLPDVLSL